MNMKQTGPQGKKTFRVKLSKAHSRREVLVGSAAAGAMVILRGKPAAAADITKTFTILHTNDLHSNFIGMAPSSDYSAFPPTELSDDKTQGGRLRASGHVDRKEEGGTPRSRSGSSA
jgi:5'-nucleotidase / UDP-sugar diphosphatase